MGDTTNIWGVIDSRTIISWVLYEAYVLGFDNDNPLVSTEYNAYVEMLDYSFKSITNTDSDLKNVLLDEQVNSDAYFVLDDMSEVLNVISNFANMEESEDTDLTLYYTYQQTNVLFSRYLSRKYNLPFAYEINELFQKIENDFYEKIVKDIDPKEKKKLIYSIEDRSCESCHNPACQNKGQLCDFWQNDEEIGKSYVLKHF